MIAAINKNNQSRTAILWVVLGAIWLNIVLLPCVHAVVTDNSSTHNCPHCSALQKDKCHDGNTSEDCQSGVATLNVQKNDFESEEQRIDFTALNSKLAHDYTISPQLREATLQSYQHSNLIPLYLKNCAFLN